jgi:hypothetical protein
MLRSWIHSQYELIFYEVKKKLKQQSKKSAKEFWSCDYGGWAIGIGNMSRLIEDIMGNFSSAYQKSIDRSNAFCIDEVTEVNEWKEEYILEFIDDSL